MKLHEAYGDAGFHTSVVTTFGVDFGVYESVVLPRLRSAKCYNNILLADSRMLAHALDGASVLPRLAGRHYTVSGVAAEGAFHPKITVQIGRERARLMVSSANVTSSGLAGNRELVGCVDCTPGPEESGERGLVAAAWRFARWHMDESQQTLRGQIEWAESRASWLFDAESDDDMVTLADGTHCALLTTGDPAGIGNRFAGLLDGETVDRLVAVSPYWDEDLSALKFLASALEAREIAVVVDGNRQLFPKAALSGLPETKLYDLGSLAQGRFVHAKLFIAETPSRDCVLYGSANCTDAAMGSSGFPGINEEACFYRELQPGRILKDLDLAKLLDESVPLDAEKLPEYQESANLDFGDAGTWLPGRFERRFDTLIWQPPESMREEPERIEFLDGAGKTLSATVSGPSEGPNGSREPRQYRLAGLTARPLFARLCFADGSVSAPAIILQLDAIRGTVREARDRQTEDIIARLAAETEESLWILEVLNRLEATESAETSAKHGTGARGKGPGKTEDDGDAPETAYETLDYDQFMAGRRIRSESGFASRNSLDGTSLSFIRSWMNRLIGDTADATEEGLLPGNDAWDQVLDLGDETSDPEAALEEGMEPAPLPVAKEVEETAEDEREAEKRIEATALREEIVKAVDKFIEHIDKKAKDGNILTSDVLRLRLMLVLLAAAGQPATGGDSEKMSSFQVLPLDDKTASWPVLMGRILFKFFGGKRPAIKHCRIDAIYDQIPDDILECWAACFWVLHASIFAMQSCGKSGGNTKYMVALTTMITLTSKVYAMTHLDEDKLKSDRILKIMDGMNDRYAGRLGLDGDVIAKAHAVAGRHRESPEN